MATNHGFVDGNKRTTVILMHTLIARSGVQLVQLPSDRDLDAMVEGMIMSVVEKSMTFNELEHWFKMRIKPAP